ncbi:MAG: purine-nucleoside phosphorylase [Chloroflexota bacterium]|nr:purine-nucleoside phosphorylase [Lentimicrobium sp.]
MLKKIKESVEFISSLVANKPLVGIILGSGLGGLTREIEIEKEIPYGEIPNFPVSTVEGHEGHLILGKLGGQQVVAMKGRFHFYEGWSMQDIAFPVRVMKFLGIKLLIVSNASGGLNPSFNIGDIMVINDHINLMGTNPLIGYNEPEFGPRFPDMKEAYDHNLIEKAYSIAAKEGIFLQRGVYAGVTGPTFETPAEYRYMHIIGADAVGMSTVPEVIAARHMQIPVFALSIITDLGVVGKISDVSHQMVLEAANKAEPLMTKIIVEMLRQTDL